MYVEGAGACCRVYNWTEEDFLIRREGSLGDKKVALYFGVRGYFAMMRLKLPKKQKMK